MFGGGGGGGGIGGGPPYKPSEIRESSNGTRFALSYFFLRCFLLLLL
jgi:hypothetical protein